VHTSFGTHASSPPSSTFFRFPYPSRATSPHLPSSPSNLADPHPPSGSLEDSSWILYEFRGRWDTLVRESRLMAARIPTGWPGSLDVSTCPTSWSNFGVAPLTMDASNENRCRALSNEKRLDSRCGEGSRCRPLYLFLSVYGRI